MKLSKEEEEKAMDNMTQGSSQAEIDEGQSGEGAEKILPEMDKGGVLGQSRKEEE